ncbi:histone-lysine N-methyltransferase SMYD3-like isoform X1 [Petromyzon marinus]|uniref:histone-lysine N-methyltransferase SMYD3-like isoform X1 n=1 Tax=Petromyzon marinus TaxID=7757 RepID=UPI003F70ADA3
MTSRSLRPRATWVAHGARAQLTDSAVQWPSMCSMERCSCLGGKGQGLRATRAVHPGQLIYSSKPYACVVVKGSHDTVCDHCLARKDGRLLRCSHCKFAYYCDASCQKGAWTEHKSECRCLKKVAPNIPTDMVRLVARILFKLARLNSKPCPSEEFYSLQQLQSHTDQMSEQMRNGLALLANTLRMYLEGEDLDWGSLLPADNVMQLLGKITCNSFSVCDGEFQDLGVAIYPSLSLLNHSCDPSCVVVFEGSMMLLRAMRDIPAGEELCISYIDTLSPSRTRRQELLRRYYFTCQCSLCEQGLGDTDMENGDKDVVEAIRSLMLKIDKANADVSQQEALVLCEAMLQKAAAAQVPSSNVQYLKLLDYVCSAYIDTHQWSKALSSAREAVPFYRQYYRQAHPQLAVQLMKIGKLENYLHQSQNAFVTFKEAFQMMCMTHGKEHSLCRRLERLLRECERCQPRASAALSFIAP